MKKHYFLKNLRPPYVSALLATLLFFFSAFFLTSHNGGKIFCSTHQDNLTGKLNYSRSHQEAVHRQIISLSEHFHNGLYLAKTSKEPIPEIVLINSLVAFRNGVRHKLKGSFLIVEKHQNIFSSTPIFSRKLLLIGTNPTNVPTTEGKSKAMTHVVIISSIILLLLTSSLVFYYFTAVKRLLQSKKETELQNDNLRNANKELDRVVYSVSHDLRSPILSIKGLVEIAQEEENVTRIKEYLSMIDQSLTDQNHFISDIIDYCRNKRKQVCIETVNLDRLIDEVITQHQHIKEARTITIKKNILADQLVTDGLRIKIILNNLLSNAIKYSDNQKPFRQIAIKTYEQNGSCVIEIKDNGIGIKEELLDHIFDMFFVADEASGSGLGLHIVKEATEYLNGSINVTSEVNIGTTFTVTIPKQDVSLN